jgi:hypothetical protein
MGAGAADLVGRGTAGVLRVPFDLDLLDDYAPALVILVIELLVLVIELLVLVVELLILVVELLILVVELLIV